MCWINQLTEGLHILLFIQLRSLNQQPVLALVNRDHSQMLQKPLGPVDLTCTKCRVPILSFSQIFHTSHSTWQQTRRKQSHPECKHSSADISVSFCRMYQSLRATSKGRLMRPCIIPAGAEDMSMSPRQPSILRSVTASLYIFTIVDRFCPLPAIIQTL